MVLSIGKFRKYLAVRLQWGQQAPPVHRHGVGPHHWLLPGRPGQPAQPGIVWCQGEMAEGMLLFQHYLGQVQQRRAKPLPREICSNRHCRYSHICRSLKAAVWSDLLKGCCPLGVKLKSKPIPLCPDFSLRGPWGAQK